MNNSRGPHARTSRRISGSVSAAKAQQLRDHSSNCKTIQGDVAVRLREELTLEQKKDLVEKTNEQMVSMLDDLKDAHRRIRSNKTANKDDSGSGGS